MRTSRRVEQPSTQRDAAYYLRQYLGLSFRQLIEKYDILEASLLRDVRERVQGRLQGAGYAANGPIMVSADHRVGLFVEFLASERHLTVALRESHPSTKERLESARVDHFGRIRALTTSYPTFLENAMIGIGTDLSGLLVRAYAALEQAFVANAQDLHRAVFRRIYDCIEVQLNVANKSDLFGRVFLFVGELPYGHYYFDEAMMRRVIAHYKGNQLPTLSPVELTVWIMSAPLPYAKSLGIESARQARPLTTAWINAGYREEAAKIFDAEIALFGSAEYASYTLAERRGYYLNLACPAEIKDSVILELDHIAVALVAAFEDGLREWSPYIRLVRSIASRISGRGEEAREEVFQLRPNFHGVGVDLKALWKRVRRRTR